MSLLGEITAAMPISQSFIRRPESRFSPDDGPLRCDHFQMAYATNDLAQAEELFKQRLGIRQFGRIGGALASGGQIDVRLAWVGTIMYEIMWAEGPGSELFMGRLPQDAGFAIKHHHLGYLIHDQAQWDALDRQIIAGGWIATAPSVNPGFMQSRFIDVPQLGHYLEYIFPEETGLGFFETVPGN